MSKTIKEALRGASLTLKEAGISGYQSEGALLLAFSMGKDLIYIYTHPQGELSGPQLERCRRLVNQRASGVPFHYLVGEKEFMGLAFKVTPGVLIPRPETEILCQAVIDRAEQRYSGPFNLLDLCTGSGALAVTLAKKLPSCRVWAVDLSPEALAIAVENARRHGVSEKVTFLEGDLWEPLIPIQGLTFSMVVSNPPYIPTGELASLQREIKEHEPFLALNGGPDGLDFYRQIFNSLHTFLEPDGMIALEVGMGQIPQVKSLSAASGLFKTMEVVKDYSGIERVLLAYR